MKMRNILLFSLFTFCVHAQENSLSLSYNNLRYSGLKQTTYNDFTFEFQNSEPEKKSVGKALLYSLILPGAGEFYVGEAGYGKFFLGLEILAWGGFFFNQHYYNSLQDDYKAYAGLHAGLLRSGKDDQYWIDIGKFNNVYAYNDQRRRDRRVDDIYPETEQNFWDWDSRENRFTYDSKRLKAVAVKNREIYFVTGILINHLVSAINAVRLARRYNRNLAHNSFDYKLVVNAFHAQNTYIGLALTKHF